MSSQWSRRAKRNTCFNDSFERSIVAVLNSTTGGTIYFLGICQGWAVLLLLYFLFLLLCCRIRLNQMEVT